MLDLAWRVLGVLVVIAIADVGWSRHSHEKSLKMSKEEVKQEHKQQDMSPELRGRIRSKARGMARARMLGNVKKADVIVTNPTHFAVALAYRAGQNAPRVLAKGADHLALRIRELGREHDVAIVENPPLARQLYATSRSGRTCRRSVRAGRRGARLRLAHQPRHGSTPGHERRIDLTRLPGPLGKLLRYSDFSTAIVVVIVVAMMLLPLPTLLLDLFITINIAGALLIVVVTMYITRGARVRVVPVAAAVHDAVPARDQRLASRGSSCRTATPARSSTRSARSSSAATSSSASSSS